MSMHPNWWRAATAVLAAPTERVICLACDTPFVTPQFLRVLAANGGHVPTGTLVAASSNAAG